jgi:hypothetical protein
MGLELSRRNRIHDPVARWSIAMIAYFILVHRLPEQFKRMFRAVYDPANHYLIHVDKSSGIEIGESISTFLADYPNATILKSKPALWGGYSLVEAELRGMAKLLEMGKDWTHFINLSGQDFPLKSQAFIRAFLARNSGKEYIRVLDQQAIRPDTMNRVSHVFAESNDSIVNTNVARLFLEGVTPYIGTQWKIVSRKFCEFACRAPEAARFKTFYKQTLIADEGFFQTLMMNNDCHGEIVADDLRMIDWVPDGDIKLRPRTFVSKDIRDLLASDNLFARKFDMNVDAFVLDALERHIGLPRHTPQSHSGLQTGIRKRARVVVVPKLAVVDALLA